LKLRIILVGLMMGAAEVVPGVSGGTIAFISGFYERLVGAIQRFTPLQLWSYRRLGLKGLWLELDINFLLMLFGAMLCSMLLLANTVSYLLEYHPVLIWAFFFGLVLASVFALGRHLAVGIATSVGISAGIAMGYGLTQLVPMEAEVSAFALFTGGCIAVCAWILPGLSGSFILLILGLYQTVILAIRDFNWMVLAYVGVGCAVGLIAFSRILSLLLDRFHKLTVAVLVGIMMGSLPKLWPWKRTTSYVIRDDGSHMPIIQEPMFPGAYAELNGIDPCLLGALLTCLSGLAVVFLLDRFGMLTPGSGDGK